MKFEWDEGKNKENIRKHELDFADAWEIFDAPCSLLSMGEKITGRIAG